MNYKKHIENLNFRIAALEKELSDNKGEMAIAWAYRDAVSAFAKTTEPVEVRAAALKRFKAAVRAKNWNLVARIAGLSGNILAVGGCEKCGINLFGEENRPADDCMPCNVKGCPFEGAEEKIIPWDDAA